MKIRFFPVFFSLPSAPFIFSVLFRPAIFFPCRSLRETEERLPVFSFLLHSSLEK